MVKKRVENQTTEVDLPVWEIWCRNESRMIFRFPAGMSEPNNAADWDNPEEVGSGTKGNKKFSCTLGLPLGRLWNMQVEMGEALLPPGAAM